MTAVASRATVLRLLLPALVLLGVGGWYTLHASRAARLPAPIQAVAPVPIQSFTLTDEQGKPVDRNLFLNKWSLVFFGYTRCPDVCPSTLLQLAQIKKRLAKLGAAQDYQFVFVNVDPQVHSSADLAAYVRYFDPDFKGLLGEQAAIIALEHDFGAYHKIQAATGGSRSGAIVHSAEVFLVDKRGRYIGRFEPPMNLDKTAHVLATLEATAPAGGKA
jgi:protein SCO1/2